MVNTRWTIHTDDYGPFQAYGNIEGSVHSLTRGDTATFTFYFQNGNIDIDALLVGSGEIYTVESGTVEVHSSVNVEENGTLNVEDSGTINTITNAASLWEVIQNHEQFADSFSVDETLYQEQKFHQRLPPSSDVSSLLLGIEPSTDIQQKDVKGIWGLLESASDERDNPLVNYRYAMDLVVIAWYEDYTRSEIISNYENTSL